MQDKKLSNPLKIGALVFNLCRPTVDLVDRIAQLPNVAVSVYPLVDVVNAATPRLARLAYSPKPPRHIVLKSLGTKEWMCSSPGVRLCWRAFRENDVLISFGLLGAASISIRLLSLFFKTHIAYAVQQVMVSHEKQRHFLIRFTKRAILSKHFYYLIQTPPTRDVLAKYYGIPHEKMIHAPFSGLDSEWHNWIECQPARHVLRKNLGIDRTDAIITLFVGTLIELKGVDDLIIAFQSVAREQDELWIIGQKHHSDKLYFDTLQTLAVKGKGRIRFFGEVPYQQLPCFYRAADIFALPSKKDTWPKVMLEAATAGLPLITTETCGAAHHIVKHGLNGFVVDKSSPGALAEALRTLVENPALRRKMGRKSIQIAREYLVPEAELSGFAKLLDIIAQRNIR